MYSNNSQTVYKRLFDKVLGPPQNNIQDHPSGLRHDFKRAVLLGNLHNETSTIHYFDRKDELKVKIEKVLACTERYLILRGGFSIPIRKIQKVDL